MPTYEPFDWYETPVYYDIIFDTDTEKEAAFLEQCHTRHATPSTPSTPPPPSLASKAATTDSGDSLSVLEPACGSGRLMAELAARGHRVAGVDLSDFLVV